MEWHRQDRKSWDRRESFPPTLPGVTGCTLSAVVTAERGLSWTWVGALEGGPRTETSLCSDTTSPPAGTPPFSTPRPPWEKERAFNNENVKLGTDGGLLVFR